MTSPSMKEFSGIMPRSFFLRIVVILLIFVSTSASVMADDWVPLFNDKDFAGWRFSDTSALPKQPRH